MDTRHKVWICPDCNEEGEFEVDEYFEAIIWSCPVCGHTHIEGVDDE
jgi:rubrerythrin